MQCGRALCAACCPRAGAVTAAVEHVLGRMCDVQQAMLGSSGEMQNGHRQGAGVSGEQLPGLAGLRFHMSNDRRSGSGQHLMPGSPNPGERSDPAVLSGQHGRSESMGSEAHLQVSRCQILPVGLLHWRTGCPAMMVSALCL